MRGRTAGLVGELPAAEGASSPPRKAESLLESVPLPHWLSFPVSCQDRIWVQGVVMVGAQGGGRRARERPKVGQEGYRALLSE